MDIIDIDVFFFGAPGKGFEAYPSNYVNIAKDQDKSLRGNHSTCVYKITSKSCIIIYSEYGLTGINVAGGIRGYRSFGVWIEIKTHELSEHGLNKIESFINDFVEDGVVAKSGLFEKGKHQKHYLVTSFDEQSDSIDKLLVLFKQNFTKEFWIHLRPITELTQEGSKVLYAKKNTTLPVKPHVTESKTVPDVIGKKQYKKKKKAKNKSFKKLILELYSNQEKNSNNWRNICFGFRAILLGTVVFFILFFVAGCLPCYFDRSSQNINKVVWICFVIFAAIIVPFKFVIDNRDEYNLNKHKEKHPERFGDDNRFIAITALIALVGLILTIYSKAITDNGSNIGELLKHSICENLQKPLIKDDKAPIFLCLDISGSVKKEVKVDRTLHDSIQTLKKDISDIISLDSNSLNPIFDSTYTGFDLLRIGALKKIIKIDKTDSVLLMLFGDSTQVVKNTRDSIARLIVNVKCHDNNSNFKTLCDSLECALDTINRLIKYNPRDGHLLIMSDFIPDINGKNVLSDSTILLFNSFLDKSITIDLLILPNANQIMLDSIKQKLKEKKITFKTKPFFNTSINKLEIGRDIHQKPKHPFYYQKPLFDTAITKISYKESVDIEGDLMFYFDNTNLKSIEGELEYRILELSDSTSWVSLVNNDNFIFNKNKEIEVRYSGTFYKPFPKLYYTIESERHYVRYISEIVFLQVLPENIAKFLLIVLGFLFLAELYYLLISILRVDKYKRGVKIVVFSVVLSFILFICFG
jgi:hypothetical protein